MLSDILARNRDWSAKRQAQEPGYFTRLAALQAPEFFWIGCSDSRVPANVVAGLDPGEVFVHRNVANIIHSSDMNMLSALEFAVEALKVREIIVCGHYGCGGISAALRPVQDRIVDHWLRHVRDIAKFYREDLESIADADARARRLCELNVAVQVVHVQESPVIGELRDQGHEVRVHGWIYDLSDGLLRDITGLVERVRAREPGCA